MYIKIEKEFIAGNLQKAREDAEEAYRGFASKDQNWASSFRLELGKVLIWQGENGNALTLLQQPLPAHSSIESQVRQKDLLSIAQARSGHPDQAEQTLLDAEKQCPEGSLRIETYTARGTVDLLTGNFDDAERAFQSALAGAVRIGNLFFQTQAFINLGVVSSHEEHYEDALVRFGNASDLARSIGARLLLEKALGNIGWIYHKTGDFQRSLVNCKEAQKQAAELGAPIDQVHWLDNAGLSEYALGDFEAARQFYERSLTLAQSIQNQELILDARVGLGFLLLRLGNPNAAEIYVREAARSAALIKNHRAALEPLLLNALLLDARGDRQGAMKRLLDLEGRAGEVPSLKWEAESNLARIYSETGHPTDADHWFQRSISTFQHQRSSLTSVESTLPFLENGGDLYLNYMKHLIDEHRPEEALNVIDESRAESLADGLHLSRLEQKRRSSQGLNARSIATRLQSTILVYSLRAKTSYLWVISPQRQQFYRLAGSETILPLIQLHTKMILASKDLLSQPNAPGRRLYNELVEPAQALIKKGGKVFIVGDEALSGLNFETLQTLGEDSHYWIEDVTITNAKSLQLLSVKQAEGPKYGDRRILLMGDPVYRKKEYAELPNASSEVKDVASHFSSDHRMVLTGAQASPQAYQLSNAGQFSYIHFVAHGTANMTVPLDSAVVLSSNRDDATVYKLYARDILKQNLNADLVTVSACNGSGVRNYSGEGLVGLAWAFLRAGSHHVIGAMWEVSDVSTPLLMDHLYGELAKGGRPDVALRSAKLAMIHSDGVFRKPLYWAPFQLYSGA
ncbi:MAG: Tetratricopeptide 1 repeat-containing protein [Edaphobacter sp.]|nr:Tetratricopeptide 1 repeat-containing protein [Edaphobacter sp.]